MKPQDLPSITTLRQFVAVVACGGPLAAERRGHGSRSNLRRSVREVERLCRATLRESESGFYTLKAGKELSEFISAGLEHIARGFTKAQHDHAPAIKVMTTPAVAHVFMPGVHHALRGEGDNLRCSTSCGDELLMQQALRNDETMVAVAPYHRGWDGFGRADLITVRLQLAVPAAWPAITTRELFANPVIREPLYWSSAAGTLKVVLDTGCEALGVEFVDPISVASMEAVTAAAANGDGYGLIVDVPHLLGHSGFRVLPLNFEPITICAFWPGRATPEVLRVTEALQKLGREIAAARAASIGATEKCAPKTRQSPAGRKKS